MPVERLQPLLTSAMKTTDCLSLDLSDWNTPGILFGKTAKQCTRPQIAQEVLAQVRAALPNGAALLPDSIVHSWFVDPAITGEGTSAVANDEPLLINTLSSWANHPTAKTKIPNLYLASDFVFHPGPVQAYRTSADHTPAQPDTPPWPIVDVLPRAEGREFQRPAFRSGLSVHGSRFTGRAPPKPPARRPYGGSIDPRERGS